MELSQQLNDDNLYDFLVLALADRESEFFRRNYHFRIGDTTGTTEGSSLVVVYCYPVSALDKFRLAFIYKYNGVEIAVWEHNLDPTEKSLLLGFTAEKVLKELSNRVGDDHKHFLDAELRKYYIDQFLESDQ